MTRTAVARDGSLFRLGLGVAALAVVALVLGIAFVLVDGSLLSLRAFGFSFWRTQVWDPVARRFGALPFIWGTLYSSFLALLLAAAPAAAAVTDCTDARSYLPAAFFTEP